MNKPKSFSGNFKQVKIENFSPDLKFINGSYSLDKKELSQTSIEPKEQILFYQNGKKIKEKSASAYSDFVSEINYKYDLNGNLIEEDHLDFKKYKFVYNQNNQLVAKEREQGYQNSWWNKYYYENNKLHKAEWRSDCLPIIDFFFQYDFQGNLIEKIGKYLYGQIDIFFEGEYNYDDLGRLINEKIERVERRDLIEETIKYDYGNYESLIVGKETSRIIGNRVQNTAETFEYDEYGNITKYKRESDDYLNEDLIWQYEYDQNYNWIKAIKFENNKPELITERLFTI